ncbi:Heat shock protein 68 [Folsomia candida]|uniref:Heat shock protein 68 n=1 Tax=Folsomia candida TaxID=158441 RepID=A0A226DA36_FOLCA|nr:Heat shock protein 68 [Folsomia candida]
MNATLTSNPTCIYVLQSPSSNYLPNVTIHIQEKVVYNFYLNSVVNRSTLRSQSLEADNNFLGSFELGGILPAPKDVPDIQVTFSVNSDGILVVRAKDVATGNVNAITIKNDHGGMSPGEIKRKIREAKDFAREDERVREAFAAKDDLERVLVRGKNLLLLKYRNTVAITDEIEQWFAGQDTLQETHAYQEQLGKLEKILHPLVKELYSGEGEQSDGNRTRTEL